MKNPANIFLVLVLLCSLIYSSCSVSRERDVEATISSFRSWVNTKATQLGTHTEEEWEQARQDFRLRTNELDNRQELLNDELKEEYRQLKERFHKLDADYAEQVVLANWRRELLGEYANLSLLNAANIVHAYNLFMERVRERHKDWSEQVWDMTDRVFEELNTQKAAIKSSLPIADEVTIKALQMEYSTLEVLETMEE